MSTTNKMSCRIVLRFILPALLLSAVLTVSAGTGNVHWVGMMLRFQPGTGVEMQAQQSFSSTLSLDTVPPPSLSPGLLTVLDDQAFVGATTWLAVGYFRIESPRNVLDPFPRFDDFEVQLPTVDNDADGIPDVLMIDRELATTATTGSFEIQGRSGAVEAVWDRAAGSYQGRCVIRMSGSHQPGNPTQFFVATYTNVFELATMAGRVDFKTGARHTLGSWALQRTGDISGYEGGVGEFSFTRSNPDVLELVPRFLHYFYVGDTIRSYLPERPFLRAGTHYNGFVNFTNGVPGSFDQRYLKWVVSISAPADHDGNQIPDFSDVAPAFAPELSLQHPSTEYQLIITGEPDATYTLETTTDLGSPAWSGTTNITLGTVPATIAVTPADARQGFWRATYP